MNSRASLKSRLLVTHWARNGKSAKDELIRKAAELLGINPDDALSRRAASDHA